MSSENQTNNHTIPPGCALTFEAPDHGVEWKLKNTETQGLVIETGDRPILRLTPEGVVIRGNLIVDGEIRREFDCHKFLGEWEVVAGEAPGNKGFAIIELAEDDIFRLTYRDKNGPNEFEYFLRFNPRTGTLDNDSERNPSHPDRCISFWDGRTRGGNLKHRIFAMRMPRTPIDSSDRCDREKFFLSWEQPNEDEGTWGAEEEGSPVR